MKDALAYALCWADGPEAEDGMPQVCMRKLDHEGEHEWTRADEVFFSMPPLEIVTAEDLLEGL